MTITQLYCVKIGFVQMTNLVEEVEKVEVVVQRTPVESSQQPQR